MFVLNMLAGGYIITIMKYWLWELSLVDAADDGFSLK